MFLILLLTFLMGGGSVAHSESFTPEEGQAYRLKAEGKDLFFRMTTTYPGYNISYASLSLIATPVYFTAEKNSDGEKTGYFSISFKRNSDTYNVTLSNWLITATPNTQETDLLGWTFESIENSNAYLLKQDKYKNNGCYLGNGNDINESSYLFSNSPQQQAIQWVIEEFPKQEAYTLKVADSNLYLNLNSKAISSNNVAISLVPMPFYFTPEGDNSERFAISSVNNPGTYLSGERFNTTKSQDPFYWTLEPVKVDGKTAYRLYQNNTGNNGYIGNNEHWLYGKELYCNLNTSQAPEIISWVITKYNEPENEDVKTSIANIAEQLTTIEDAYKGINSRYTPTTTTRTKGCIFPTRNEKATTIYWPNEYEKNFSGLDGDYFKLLTHAQQAIESQDPSALSAANTNLENFISLSKQYGYAVSLTYNISTDYGTIYLPFGTTRPNGLEIYECTGVNKDGVLLLTKGSNKWETYNFGCNIAYIVEVTDQDVKKETFQFISYLEESDTQVTGKNNTNGVGPLKGTHKAISAPIGSYVLQDQTYGLGFYLVGEESKTKVPASKCYLDLSGEYAQGLQFLRFPDGTLTAIDAIDNAKPANDATYDLSGRRVGKAVKGIYITGGRKVLVK